MEQYAIWFYGHSDPTDFIKFQKLYLDNIFALFLIQEGFIESIDGWYKTGRITFLDETKPFKKHGNKHNKEQTAPKERDVVIQKLKNYHVPIPKNIDLYCVRALKEYLTDLKEALHCACYMLGGNLRGKSNKNFHLYESNEYKVLVHTKHTGSILIKGKIGNQDVIFCYGDSTMYEIPCTTEECLKQDSCDDIIKTWSAKRVGMFDGVTYKKFDTFLNEKIDKKRKRISKHEPGIIEKAEKSCCYLQTPEDVSSFLTPSGTTPQLAQILAKLHKK